MLTTKNGSAYLQVRYSAPLGEVTYHYRIDDPEQLNELVDALDNEAFIDWVPMSSGFDDDRLIPFQKGTQRYHITKALISGGLRKEVVDRLVPLMTWNKRTTKREDFDATEETEVRINLTVSHLRQQGWRIVQKGRGSEAQIRAVPGPEVFAALKRIA